MSDRNNSSMGWGKTAGLVGFGALLGAGVYAVMKAVEAIEDNEEQGARASASSSRMHQTGHQRQIRNSCQICLKDMMEKGTMKTLPCKHKFHQRCIDKVTHTNGGVCPECGNKVDSQKIKSCSVCLDPMDKKCDIAFLPCMHQYHITCIQAVFAGGCRLCPECRHELSDDDLKALRKLDGSS